MIVITSGFYNPLHAGHIRYLEAAKKLGDVHITIVSNDDMIKAKGSKPFMSTDERQEIVGALRCVDMAIVAIDTNYTVRETIRHIHEAYPKEELIFANGGDVTDLPDDKEFYDKLGVKLVFGVGGSKVRSSSKLIRGMQ